MKRRMVKRLRQLNSPRPHELFGAIQQALVTCCGGPTTRSQPALPSALFCTPQ